MIYKYSIYKMDFPINGTTTVFAASHAVGGDHDGQLEGECLVHIIDARDLESIQKMRNIEINLKEYQQYRKYPEVEIKIW